MNYIEKILAILIVLVGILAAINPVLPLYLRLPLLLLSLFMYMLGRTLRGWEEDEYLAHGEKIIHVKYYQHPGIRHWATLFVIGTILAASLLYGPVFFLVKAASFHPTISATADNITLNYNYSLTGTPEVKWLFPSDFFRYLSLVVLLSMSWGTFILGFGGWPLLRSTLIPLRLRILSRLSEEVEEYDESKIMERLLDLEYRISLLETRELERKTLRRINGNGGIIVAEVRKRRG